MSRGQPEIHSKFQAGCGLRRETLYQKGEHKEAWCWVPAARAPEHQIHPLPVYPVTRDGSASLLALVERLYIKGIYCVKGPEVAGCMAEGLGMTEFCLLQVGSFGNGTVLRSTTDVELVVFLSCFHSFQEEAKHHQAALSLIQKRMFYCQDLLDLGFCNLGVTEGVPRGLIFTIRTRETWEPISVTIVPAYRALGKGNRSPTCPACQLQEAVTPCVWWPQTFLHSTHVLGWG